MHTDKYILHIKDIHIIISDMQNNKSAPYLEIQTDRKNPVGVIRSSSYVNGVCKKIQHGRIKGLSLNTLKLLRLSFREKTIAIDDPQSFKILESKEYGASFAALSMIKDIGLDQAIYSKPSVKWVQNTMAMIAGRLVYQGSKLSLANQYENSSLWEQVGITDRPNVRDDCYFALDELLSRQDLIQRKLAKKHLSDGHLVLYDITSSYLEGEYKDSELVKYGYNRDKKKGHEQIVIGLLCSKDGCPVAVEIYPGNTKDETTVIDQVRKIKDKYGIKKVIFVGDRGMVTKTNIEKLKDEKDLFTISALTRPEIVNLLDRKVIQTSLFDDKKIHEVIDPDNLSKRYCLCRNPFSADRDRVTHERLLELTQEALTKIQEYKRKSTIELLGARIGKVLEKYKMGKYISWGIEADKENISSLNHKIIWELKEDKIKEAQSLYGCYIISTDVKEEELSTNEVVASYKKLELVEQAFRNLKTVQLEMRPIYHKRDDRIKAHIFLCMLAYYVQWHMQSRLKPLFDNDKKGENRRWTFANVVETLKQITRNKTSSQGIEFYQNSTPTKSQQKILDYLAVKI